MMHVSVCVLDFTKSVSPRVEQLMYWSHDAEVDEV